MWLWWLMLGCGALIPVIMVIAGRGMWKHPPKEINGVVGYRTARSMRNQETWAFAHAHAGRLWWRLGWGMLGPSVLVLLPAYGRGEVAVSVAGLAVMAAQAVGLIGSVLATERALKRAFTDAGERRRGQ